MNRTPYIAMPIYNSRLEKSAFSGGTVITSNPSHKTMVVQNEAARLQELYRYQVLDTSPDPDLDELTRFAAEICQTPIALISLIDTDRQWFKSKLGISLSETPRYISLCTHTAQQSDVFVVADTMVDEQFCHNPWIVGSSPIRFYAGIPLITPAGFVIGTLSVADYQVRHLHPQQFKQLQILSRQVMAQLELKRKTIEHQQTQVQIQQLQQQCVVQEMLSQQELVLFNLGNQIRNSLNLDTILQITIDEICKLLTVDYCHFFWCLPIGNQFNLTVTHEAKRPNLSSLNWDFSDYESGMVGTIRNLEVLQVDDVYSANLSQNTPELFIRQGIRSVLLLPIKTYSGQLGAIVCSHGSGVHAWTVREVQILRAVTDQLAIALEQAELFAETRAAALAAQTQTQYLTEALHKLQQTQTQLIQHEKMSSLGQLVAGVAHEINNPVNFISGNITHADEYIQGLLQIINLYQEQYPQPVPLIQEIADAIDLDFIKEDLPQLISSMKMGVERIFQIVLSLRNFSRLDETEMKPVNLQEGLENTLLILHNRLKKNKVGVPIQVIREYENLPPVECLAGQLNQVFMNLLGNAIDAMDEMSDHPTITISTELIPCPIIDISEQNLNAENYSIPQNKCIPQVVIRIRDNGCGMSEAVQRRIFDPFFTTKPVGKGTGLGLSISYQIVVEKHHGTILCLSRQGEGTEFRIQIPIQQKDTET